MFSDLVGQISRKVQKMAERFMQPAVSIEQKTQTLQGSSREQSKISTQR